MKKKSSLTQSPTYQSRIRIGFQSDKDIWKQAPAIYNHHTLKILGHPVMEDWERPYMKQLARIATRKGGAILEVGFGMGISSGFIQESEIASHTIIEANHTVAEQAYLFARHTRVPTAIIEGFWEEGIDDIPSGSIDGILFDTYPLSEREIHKNHFAFFPHAHRLLKKDGIFTYYSDEPETFSQEHFQRLIAAGFEREHISGCVVPVQPPADCLYWHNKTLLAPQVTK
ncbi:class I SAM-dependent methyltransferase [Candidatus Roizmanbacteria bacterium]|nr:class I SAM-dependent methyltransferase [Candidatus Roizmanbacteria bacterium]